MLDGVQVLVLGAEAAARAGRALADLGATVTRMRTHHDPLDRAARVAFEAGIEVITDPDTAELTARAASADVVVDEPGARGAVEFDPNGAPLTHWVRITPFGLDGPRATWRASDLGVMAATGNLFATGDPDRAPLRPSQPAAYAHVAGEAAFGAISTLRAHDRQIIDVSMQECVLVANMGAAGRAFREPARGRRSGAKIGRTREIYPTLDGFVSFGIRGGNARAASMRLIAELVRDAGIHEPALAQDWDVWSQNTADDTELAAMEAAIGAYFASMTSRALYAIACETNLMLAPVNSPREIFASEQLDAREWFVAHDAIDRFPRSFVSVTGARAAGPNPPRAWSATPRPPRIPAAAGDVTNEGLWGGVRILEFGSGAAGPIATRYFVEHGATVLRVESPSRPDFLRAMAVSPSNPHGLEGAPMYDALNCGKRHVTLNLKHPDAIAIVRRLVAEWADAVAENYAPRAMTGFGLGFDDLRTIKPDLVMVSACLNGQTGPHRNYPGFGGQGSALSGWNWVTGWPDREPVGPFGTITDSLAPRYVAAALAAGIAFRSRTGRGCYLDVSQVEAGLYALTPWLLGFALDGDLGERSGNTHPDAIVHGVYPSADDERNDRWVAIAAWNAAELDALATTIGANPTDESIAAWTSQRHALDAATRLQRVGVEAVPVADFLDVLADPQLAHRDHFIARKHPVLGEGRYERNGLRASGAPSGYDRAGPTLGQDNRWVFEDLLGLSAAEIESLARSGALS